MHPRTYDLQDRDGVCNKLVSVNGSRHYSEHSHELIPLQLPQFSLLLNESIGPSPKVYVRELGGHAA